MTYLIDVTHFQGIESLDGYPAEAGENLRIAEDFFEITKASLKASENIGTYSVKLLEKTAVGEYVTRNELVNVPRA